MWAGDQRQKLFRNLETLPGDILLSAVTAPGAGVLRWDTQQCAALGEHRHSGKLGCRVRRVSAREWNESAGDRWRRLHRRAYQDAVKRVGKRSVFLVARVWEMQARGVLHVHPVLAYGTARQMAGARCYLARLAELAPQYGFGFVHHSPKHVKPQPAQNAAAYLSSYFVKGKRGKETLWESARSPAMPRSIVHVSVKLTQETGCTMRTLRLKRAIFYVWRATLPFEEVRAVSRILQAFPARNLSRPAAWIGHRQREREQARRAPARRDYGTHRIAAAHLLSLIAERPSVHESFASRSLRMPSLGSRRLNWQRISKSTRRQSSDWSRRGCRACDSVDVRFASVFPRVRRGWERSHDDPQARQAVGRRGL